MIQILIIAIGFMVSQTIVKVGYESPMLHWLLGLVTLLVIVIWEQAIIRAEAMEIIKVVDEHVRKKAEQEKEKSSNDKAA